MAVDRGPGTPGELERQRRETGVEREAVFGRKFRRGLDARRERLAGDDHDTPPVMSRAIGPRGATPGVVIVSHRLARPSVFRDPSGSRPGFPVPLADRVTLLSAPVRMPDGRGRPRRRVNGVFH